MGTNSSVWLGLWSVFLAIGWLLPNHSRPWTSFHSEVWVAALTSVIVLLSILKAPSRFSLDILLAFIAAVTVIPFVQFAFDQIAYFGQAWIGSLYILGLLLAILAGRFFELSYPDRLIDYLSLAIGIASLCSVYFQIIQWLALDGLGIWLNESDPSRPSANLGQPNQLATLLLWGCVATLWGWSRSKIGSVVAIVVALILLFGVALTGSRTAWLAMAWVISLGWWWRGIWCGKFVPLVLTALGVYFAFLVLILNLHVPGAEIRFAVSSDLRFSAWQLFFGAVLERPLFGYGWGQTAEAHISVAQNYPALNVVFAQAHNIFLDLILWCGVPIGGSISIVILYFFWRCYQQVKSPKGAVLFLYLLIVANHAMLEFPLQYAYFLLPFGIIFGVVSANDQRVCQQLMVRKTTFVLVWCLSVVMLAITFVDYMKLENSYRLLRMEWAGFNLELDPQPPEMIALNQWSHIIKHARVLPSAGMGEAALDDMRRVTLLAHKPIDFRLLSSALMLNGKVPEAELWLERMRKVGVDESRLTFGARAEGQ